VKVALMHASEEPVERVGHLDRRAQAKLRKLLRPDTPRFVTPWP
jgi:hypothetical protein